MGPPERRLSRAPADGLEQTRPSEGERARGLVSSRVSGSRVEALRFAPPPDLADVVDTFWVGRWDLPEDAPHQTRLLSDPCVNLCFEQSSATSTPARRLVGVWTQLWERTLSGRGIVRAAKLRAGAAGAFVEDATATRNRLVDLDQIFPAPPGGYDALPEDDADALAVLAEILRRHRRPSPDTPLAVRACDLAQQEPSILRTEQLAEVLGLGTRDLQRLFRQHVGATPKFVIRRHRLQEAAGRLEKREYVNLAELAASLGYADQAHLTRDFKNAVGTPPSVFAEEVHR